MQKINVSERSLLFLVFIGCIVITGCSNQPTPVTSSQHSQQVPLVEGMSESDIHEIGRRYGPLAESRVRYWQLMINASKASTDQIKLQQANDFINGARFVDDIEIWQTNDYWSTPLEFLIMDAGDCEDFSIAKYFTLEKMGVAMEKMRLTYVKALNPSRAHMVLTYYSDPSSVPLVLDNLNPSILPATERMDLIPVYSFNGEDLWLAKTRSKQEKVGSANTLKPWKELNTRMTSGLPSMVVPAP